MRQVNNLKDVQTALNELFNFKDKFTTKDWDNSGLRITNASPGINPNDYATVSQIPPLPSSSKSSPINYTIVFNPPSNATVGSISPPFVVGPGRSGRPTQIWLGATNLPTTGPLSIQMNVNGNGLLVSNLTMNAGVDLLPVSSSIFNTPLKHLAIGDVVTNLMVSIGGASLISVGLVVVVD